MPERLFDPFEKLDDAQRNQLVERPCPRWLGVMLATLTKERFSDDDWIFERKLDGERCLALRDGDKVSLYSRNRKLLNSTYPELVAALQSQLVEHFLVDGEIVAFEGSITSFSRLQQRMQIKDAEDARATNIAVYYYLFDLIFLDRFETTQLDLRTRKKLLRDQLKFKDPIRLTVHRNAEGEAFFREACRKGWEGIIAKRAASTYQPKRSRDWLKFKCVNQQEFVIGGFTDPRGERIGFGALLMGYYQDDGLVYAGKVGTGYDDEMLAKFGQELADQQQDESPFVDESISEQGVHWVRPVHVAEVGFTEWTREGLLRHPRFLGLRRDKSPLDVHRETPGE